MNCAIGAVPGFVLAISCVRRLNCNLLARILLSAAVPLYLDLANNVWLSCVQEHFFIMAVHHVWFLYWTCFLLKSWDVSHFIFSFLEENEHHLGSWIAKDHIANRNKKKIPVRRLAPPVVPSDIWPPILSSGHINPRGLLCCCLFHPRWSISKALWSILEPMKLHVGIHLFWPVVYLTCCWILAKVCDGFDSNINHSV